MTEPCDYTDDWKEYWALKYDRRGYRRLKSAAEEPIHQSLTASIGELNPDSSEYDFAIDTEHLRNYPDQVLRDARRGFAKFVAEEDIDTAKGCDYDLLFIHINFHRNRSFRYPGFQENSFDSLLKKSNKLVTFQGSVVKNVQRERKARTIGYRCPAGHTSRIIQPIYDNEEIEICGKIDCTNSSIQVSSQTETIPVVNFGVTIDDHSIDCVTAGAYSDGRKYEELLKSEGNIQITGILRNVKAQNGGVAPRFEVLSMNNAVP